MAHCLPVSSVSLLLVGLFTGALGSAYDFVMFKSDDCSGDPEKETTYSDGACYSSYRGKGSSQGSCSADMQSVQFHWYEECEDCSCSATTVWSEQVGACFQQGAGVAGTSKVLSCKVGTNDTQRAMLPRLSPSRMQDDVDKVACVYFDSYGVLDTSNTKCVSSTPCDASISGSDRYDMIQFEDEDTCSQYLQSIGSSTLADHQQGWKSFYLNDVVQCQGCDVALTDVKLGGFLDWMRNNWKKVTGAIAVVGCTVTTIAVPTAAVEAWTACAGLIGLLKQQNPINSYV
mmetsp:Transcript_4537/g.8286  ORF Transcript_4537/g.8286 Transcript_4537/m.8286 type:complete len:287 (+) Transcript_4537:113-973(+)